MRRHCLSLAALGVMSACASAPAPAVSPQPTPPPAQASTAPAPAAPARTAIRIPQRVAMFSFQRRYNNEDPAAGIQLRYAGPDSLWMDVFVYPGPDLGSKCPVACAQPVLEAEVKDFEANLPEMIKRGMLDSARVALTEPLAPPADAPWKLGHRVILAVFRDGRAQRSDFHLFYLPHYRVKVRATYVEGGGRPANVRAFLDALIPELVRQPSPG